ncbi:MAG TPA: sulfurtransferase [Chloroflexia bacterium]|nr:sulfurtransferase [Chloroflexia bacterium]
MSGTENSLNTTPYLVETDWLAAHLNDPQVRIIDMRYYWNRPGSEAYLEGHIPGAVYLQWDTELSDQENPVKFMVLPPEKLAAIMSRLGVDNSMTVVAYDDEGGHYSSRLWWTLNYYGFDNCRILHGGVQKWQRENRPWSTEVPLYEPKTFVTGSPRLEWRKTASDVLDHLNDPETALVDVRRPSEYTGEEVRAARGGRIPGAINLLWLENLDSEKWTFKDATILRQRFEEAGVTPDKKVVTYCHGGVRACHAAIALKMLGYPNVLVYDGSWEEWGNDPVLPIEQG